MALLLFLLFGCLNAVPVRSLREMWRKDYFTNWPLEIRTFQDDNYYCRRALGMSYFMQGVTNSEPGHRFSIFAARFYKLYSIYPPKNIQPLCLRIYYYNGYTHYVQALFGHMMIVDGMTLDGGTKETGSAQNGWSLVTTRYAVNYTIDGKAWLSYKNDKGETQEFRLLDILRLDRKISSLYVKFQPRIIAHGIRILPLSHRRMVLNTDRNRFFCLSMEFYGCEYAPETQGLQTGFKRRDDLILGRRNLFDWQLWSKLENDFFPLPFRQPYITLSRNEPGQIPDGVGWCPTRNSPQLNFEMLELGTFKIQKFPLFQNVKIEESTGQVYAHKRLEMHSLSNSRAKCHVTKLEDTRLTFTPAKIIRSKGCSTLLFPFGETFCHEKGATNNQFWEIDLKRISILEVISMKGHHRTVKKSWVSTLTIAYGTDGEIWLPIRDRYAPDSILQANKNQYDVARLTLRPRLRARFLRFTPLTGHGDLCLRVEVRGCFSEPWLDEVKRIEHEAKKTGFSMWHILVGHWNHLKELPISCFPENIKYMEKFAVRKEIYEIIQNNEFLWPAEERLAFTKNTHPRFIKCVARDENDDIISKRLYVITGKDNPGLILPMQEVGLMQNGGIPVLVNPGTLWTYEPNVAKITMLYFPDISYYYTSFGAYLLTTQDYFYLTKLGPGMTLHQCFNHAVAQHHRYFVIDTHEGQCFGSWYLPVAAKDYDYQRRRYRGVHIYKIYQSRREYTAVWWRGAHVIGKYKVKSQPVFDHPVLLTQPTGNGRFQCYFDSYITTHSYESHTLVINGFTSIDVMHYALEIQRPIDNSMISKRTVHLRHFAQPRVTIPPYTGSCINLPLVISAVCDRKEYRDYGDWDTEWMKVVNGRPHKTGMETSDPFVLKAQKATLRHAGLYRFRARNRYGIVEAHTNVEVLTRLPKISYATPSPHAAVEDTSDVLQVSVEDEHNLISVDWEFNEKPIFADDHYAFPGSVDGHPETRKMLKLNNMHPGMSGIYRVTTKAKYCQFQKDIVVEVYVRPKLIVSPSVRTIYQIAGGNTTQIKVVVAGGMPEPQKENLLWYKNSKLLQFTRTSRLKVDTKEWIDTNKKSKTEGKRIGWNSTLSIHQPHETDSGTYSFMVSFVQTNYTIERVVKVTRIKTDFVV